MGETKYVKIGCPSCSEHVEFPLEMRGHIINCPHCTLSMTLEVPGTSQLPSGGNLYQRLRALNNLGTKPAEISLPEAFLKPQTRHRA